jgi:hypothetical protein
MFKRPCNRIAGGVGADQLLDAVLCLPKLAIASFQERNPLLIPRKRLFEASPAVFKIAHNALQLGKRLFKGLWFVGVTHGLMNTSARYVDTTRFATHLAAV